jgi:hypothetical protein
MSSPISTTSKEMRNQLKHLQKDFTDFHGNPFKYFYCPLMVRDEDAELCLGHVVNDKIPNSSGVRIVQRKDVDGFYGRVFESDFVTLLQARSVDAKGVVFDSHLSKKMKPRITVDGEVCEHYLSDGHNSLPPEHTGIILEGGNTDAIKVVLKKTPSEFMADRAREWKIVIERDCRVTALVSLIKAAYLTLFRMLGYRYALSCAGLEVGCNILGKFYRMHGHKPTEEARNEARQWFRPYVNMMRPIEGFSGRAPRGTIEDNVAMVCFGSSGKPFGLIVCIRTNKTFQGVLMPGYDNAESAATYFDFLNNKKEKLRVNYCEFSPKDKCWHGSEEPVEVVWPKEHDSFRFD